MKKPAAPPPTVTDLAQRTALPDTLRALVAEFPRKGWQENPNYSQLIAFWLDKHLSFRSLTQQLDRDVAEMLDGNLDARQYQQRLHRFGGMLINDLHGHHQIEDAHYFPVMAKLDQTTARGFEILDSDHHQMDAVLADLAGAANGVLQTSGSPVALKDKAAAFKATLNSFAPMLNRHLIDEEELVVPILLKYAPPEFR